MPFSYSQGMNPMIMQALKGQAQGIMGSSQGAGPQLQIPQTRPAMAQPMSAINPPQQYGAQRNPGQQSGTLNPLQALNTANRLNSTANGQTPADVQWLKNLFSTPQQNIGSTPYGGAMNVPQTAGNYNVGGGLGQPSMQYPGADTGLSSNYGAGGGLTNAPQAGYGADVGSYSVGGAAPTTAETGSAAAGSTAAESAAAAEGGSAAATQTGSATAGATEGGGGALGSLGPIGAFAAAIMAGKTIEHGDPNSVLGRGLLSMLGPSYNQIQADPRLGVTTASGMPWINGFIRNDSSAKAAPEWMGLFS